MERQDKGMAFMLQYENVAWYEDGKVKILDRRIYPTEVKFVTCSSHIEVAQAIKDMVTQSAGPYTAAGMGMALAAYEVKDKCKNEQIEFLKKASHTISNARPTTANRLRKVTKGSLEVAIKALESGGNAVDAIFENTLESLNRRYYIMGKVGEHLASLFPKNGNILTQCFGETIIGTMLKAARKNNNDVKLICAETRPYLQGAKLTSSCCSDMGFDTTVITDNMVAYMMNEGKIDLFTSAADTIARDGYIANKIGTYQIALLAKNFNIPYYVTGIPDSDKYSHKDIVIEMRDSKDVLEYRGIKNTLPNVKAIYPSFDITPAELIKGIVTDKGIFSPEELEEYFNDEIVKFY